MSEPRQRTEIVQSEFDQAVKPPSIAVVEAIAAIENLPATALPMTLHDHINPESLDELMASNSDVSVTFFVNQYQIQVTENSIAVTCC